MLSRAIRVLLRVLNRLSLQSGRSWSLLRLRAAISVLRKIASHPQVSELFRFIFLGTIVETGRKIAQNIAEFTKDFFVVKAEFALGDFAYDWVVTYLEHHRVWNESRSFKVVARNFATRPYPSSTLGKIDGHPDPLYEPATAQSPSLFRWRGYWMSISKSSPGLSHYDKDTGVAVGGTLVLSLWSRNRHVLDEFVSAARDFYVNSQVLPRKQLNVISEPSESLLTAYFPQSDLAYEWMLEYLRSSNALTDVMNLSVTTKQSDLGWGTGSKDAVRYMPAPESMQRFLFTSPRTGRSTWLQVVINSGVESWSDPSSKIGGSIIITLHSSDREVLGDLIDCAKSKYVARGTSRVTVHLTDANGRWGKTVTKSRRALSTLVLPEDIKETILSDARDFLASEKWYNRAGIPHRRGYLLYGAPGTGKSSTIHAIAGELGLEIYFISLANPGIDDYTLARLISDTPSRCILLIEDIDCAFPSREDLDEEEENEHHGNSGRAMMMPPKSAVTLSGLLNVLDSVSSEEGRLTFATTNHIANLDPALIRAGRMDLKIKYGLATTGQVEQVFQVFFPTLNTDQDDLNDEETPLSAPYTTEDIDRSAAAFAAVIPNETYSVAQIQGYLLTKKGDPWGAVQGVDDWLLAQQTERRAIAESKRRWRAEVDQWRKGFQEPSPWVDVWERVVGDQGQAEAEVVPDAAETSVVSPAAEASVGSDIPAVVDGEEIPTGAEK
ncbi:P-loop containing nucleoside triphosphate hydrolase protein [Mycena galericulata]|nr:P-loop containing nucleoside triphosphate hydrolase protein [Mycena galericulata]